MLPIGNDVGYRVNLISCLLSVFTVLFLYLSIVLIVRQWRGKEETTTDKITVYGSAAVGALTFAFSHSFWFNTVEAEVYSPSMFFTAVVVYLALLWLEYSEVPKGNRILLFIFYLIGLSTGVHLLNVLTILSITYIVAYKKFPASPKMFLATGLIGAGITFLIYPGLIQGLPTMITHFSIWSVVIIFVGLVILAFYLIKKDQRVAAFGVLSILLVFIGYSTYIMIKIRSGMDPFLDENDPETWAKLLSYLNREQYGSESLIASMFDRKAPFWSYQINKMYIRYFNWQFLGGQGTPMLIFPFLLGIIGMVHHFFRDSKHAFVVFTLFIMTGLAIILYVNQPDPQPRERDYSYVGSFYAFAIWIGIGVITLIEMIQDGLKKINPSVTAIGVTAVCLIAAPVQMVVKNYHTHDRSGNYVAWDYSYNLLQTCEPNAILYTNGDNDTFPLWYLQMVEGVRTDVRVANLSLLNTGWFIQQIRDKDPKVPMPSKINDSYIKNVIDSREVNSLIDRRWQETRKVSIDGPTIDSDRLVWDVPAPLSYPIGPGGANEYFLRVQDLMILNTIAANHWERPIYFAVTVSDDNLIGLRNIKDPSKNYLSMEGLAFKLHPEPVPMIDGGKIAENMFYKYKYRNIDNPDVYFNPNIQKLLGNYRQGLIQLAFTYLSTSKASGDSSIVNSDLPLEKRLEILDTLSPYDKALTALDFMESTVPEDLIPIKYDLISLQIGRLYASLGKPEGMTQRLDRLVEEYSPLDFNRAYEYAVYYLSEAKNMERAQRLLDYCLQLNPSLEAHQRVAYAWMQLAPDTTYIWDIFDRFLAQHNDRQTKLQVASQATMLGLDNLAFSIYEPLWMANPSDREAVAGMIEYYTRHANYDRAKTLIRDWLGAFPNDMEMTQKMLELEMLSKDAQTLP